MTRTAFKDTLQRHGRELTRAQTTTLQINVGLACDLTCRHCHLEAGPERTELMNAGTVEAVIAAAGRFRFNVIDITGGAPERLPMLPRLISGLAPLTPRLIVRTNLTALARSEAAMLPELYRDSRAVIMASFPAINAGQTEAQRGKGAWEAGIAMLKRLNGLGYGMPGSGLELGLVVNPAGAFLPADQLQSERRFRSELGRRYGIVFTSLFTFANVPLGRFKTWLESSGNLDGYLNTLEKSFNPCTLDNLMCRSLISVAWDGTLYDCDFNLASGLPHAGRRMHIGELEALPPVGTLIQVGDYCYACTAGSGFT